MEALMRTGSGGFHFPSPTPAAHHHHHHHEPPLLSRTRSAGAAGFSARPSTAVHLETKDQHHHLPLPNTLRRASSCDSNAASFFHSTTGSPSSLSLALTSSGARSSPSSCTAKHPALVAEDLDLDFSSGGAGRGSRVGGGGRRPRGGDHNNSGMGGYYKEMLQADPSNPLLLMNYGKYLHDVQGDLEGAEDCFGRAVLASPDDGEALSLYGNLVWEAHGDGQRAHDYLQRAVQAAPEDCYVLASYANFLWDADDDDEEEDHQASSSSRPTGSTTAAMVKAY